MSTITVALAYLNGNIIEMKDGGYMMVVKEPINYKDKHTGEYKKRFDIKYKIHVPKHRMPDVLLEHGDFLMRKEKGISISICFTGNVGGILTNEEGNGNVKDARVREAQIMVYLNTMDHSIGFVKAMQFKGTKSDLEDGDFDF